MLKKILIGLKTFIFLGGLYSCSHSEPLNMQAHYFGSNPSQIIWLQIPGLHEEHLAMLRFAYGSLKQRSAFESALCLGKAWNYNLTELRSGAIYGPISQINSKREIKGNCEDFSRPAVWNFFQDRGYKVTLFEVGANKKSSLIRSGSCKVEAGKKPFLQGVTYFSMGKAPARSKFFHHTETRELLPGTYYDRSCQKGACFSSVTQNIEFSFRRSGGSKGRSFVLIRDFRFVNALKHKNIIKAKEVLFSLEQMLKRTLKKNDLDKTLVLVSAPGGRPIEFPLKGVDWELFERNGSKIIYKRDSLIGTVFAWGSRSENFCGIYEETDIGKRLMTPREVIYSKKSFF